MTDLDTLRPEVRDAVNEITFTAASSRPDLQKYIGIIRAELLRLASENFNLHEANAGLYARMERLERAEAELAALKAAGRFAVGVMDAFWSPPDVGNLDGFDLQELAEKHGMLTRFDVPEGGCCEVCNCICEGADPGDDCYRWSEAFKRVRTGVED